MAINKDDFEQLEANIDAFDLRVDGIPIWERIRRIVYREINQQKGDGQAHTNIDDGLNDYIEGVKLWTRNLFRRNPFFTETADVMFVGHPRRKKEDDDYWWDIYCDPIHESCNFDAVHFEKPYLLQHRQPSKTENIRYLDLIHFSGTIQRKLGFHKVELSNNKRQKIEEIEQEIATHFGIQVNIEDIIVDSLQKRRSLLWLYSQLLKRVKPEIVVVVVSYGKETIIEACKNQEIPVVELQHGVIHDRHFGYSYPGSRTKEMFPDYLFTFGDFWKDNVEFPIPNDRVLSVGYPYLEQTKRKYEDVQLKNQILFISQGNIGKKLSKFALKVDQHPEIKHEVVYKLHPGEYDRWMDEYPWLVDADFEVVDNPNRQLYQLFAESKVQIGVGSTAIYEGLCFDLETYVYDCSGSDILEPLVNHEVANRISSINQLIPLLGKKEGDFNCEYFFSPNASERICNAIESLL